MLREEIVAVVERGKKSVDAERLEINTRVVCEFYGIGVTEDLSGEKIAKKYGWEKKQSVDQCVKYNFINRLWEGDLESLSKMIERFGQKSFWTSVDFTELIKEYVGCEVALGNFKKLIKKLYPNAEICFLDAAINDASRQDLAEGKFIAMNRTKCDEMRGLLKGVGQYGLVRTDEYMQDCAKDEEARQILEALLAISTKTKLVHGKWFIRENEDNIIFNSLRMIACVTDSVRTDVLEKIIYQVIRGNRRKNKYTCPPKDVISAYLRDSVYVKQEKEYSHILVKAKSGNIEKRYLDVVNVFDEAACDELLCADFTRYLMERGNTRHNCTSILATCPLILVDKTGGRGKHVVYYVRSFAKKPHDNRGRILLNQAEELNNDRYLIDAINDAGEQSLLKEYEDKPKVRQLPRIENKKKVYPRNPEMSKIALALAGYKCELDGCTTVLFRRRNSDVNYTEPHHIVPMAFSDKYKDASLDVPGNIISLCSQCHNRIHYGEGYEMALTEIYRKRVNRLKKCGIDVTLDDLLNCYK